MLIVPPPGSPAATVGAEVWEGRRPPLHPQLAAWPGAVISGPRENTRGSLSSASFLPFNFLSEA